MQQSAVDEATGEPSIQRSVKRVSHRWKVAGGDTNAPLRLAPGVRATPILYLQALIRRVVASLGPDTFVLQRLLPPRGEAYSTLKGRQLRWLSLWLRWSFPLFTATALWLILTTGTLDPRLLPAAFLFCALVLIHFRTRYRIALIPWMALAAADAAETLRAHHLDTWSIVLGLALLAGAGALAIHPPLTEEPGEGV
jgi:hypothetical protein